MREFDRVQQLVYRALRDQLVFLGPVTQLLQLVAPTLHHKLGLTEENALRPEYTWFLLDERAIAIADMTYLIAGGLFIWMSLLGNSMALIFGIYTCSCYVFVSVLVISRWMLLSRFELNPSSGRQLVVYVCYMLFYLVFGLVGLFYLWDLVKV